MKKTIITLASVAALAGSANAQNVEWVQWTSGSPNGTSSIGTITASFGSSLGFVASNLPGNVVGDSFAEDPYISGNSLHVAIRASTTNENFIVDMDLTNYNNSNDSYLAFGNLGGAIISPNAQLELFDSLNNKISTTTLSLVGNFDHQIGGVNFTNDTTWNPVTGRMTHGTLDSSGSGAMDTIIFSNLSSNIARIRYTGFANDQSSSGTSGFAGSDSVVISIGTTQVPEPSSTALLGLGALGLLVRRKR